MNKTERQSFKNVHGKLIVYNMIATIQMYKEYLSEIDGAIGDGDHGINMNKGFSLCQERLIHTDSLTDALATLGNVLLAEIGGSMGPLYGMFFLAMKSKSEGKEHIDKELFGVMISAAREEIASLGSAQVGDKTLMDTLIPAVRAYDTSLSDGYSFLASLDEMDAAADVGYKSTQNLVANLGRASRLGERSRGVLDAGATSCYLLLHSMKESIGMLINTNGDERNV